MGRCTCRFYAWLVCGKIFTYGAWKSWYSSLAIYCGYFNKEFSKTWTIANIKTKVDWLRKTYKTQRVNVVKSTGGTPSTWRWYEICDKIWGCTPKTAGIPGAKENGEDVLYIGRAVNLDDDDGRGVINLNSECTMFSLVRPTSNEDE